VSEPDAADANVPRPSVFLSYASEDRPAARLLGEALPGYGLEVWYDESELGGGDAWDQKIRRQIRDCDYFMPLISAQTERRHEGYFRREWRLAVERTLDMADDHLYLLPIVIDDTPQSGARVPERFLSVQWLKVPGGRATTALESLCRRIVAGAATGVIAGAAPRAAAGRVADAPRKAIAEALADPVFPVEEPGQRVRFWVEVGGWFCRSAWRQFRRLPRWVRIVASVWLCIALVSRCDSSSKNHADETAPSKPGHRAAGNSAAEDSPAGDSSAESTGGGVSLAKIAKLKVIARQYEGVHEGGDVDKLAAAIAREFGQDNDEDSAPAAATFKPVLAIAFTGPPGDAAAAKLADSAFAMTYGMIEISHQAQVGLTREPLASADLGAAVARGKTAHATYVLYGSVARADTGDKARALTTTIATVADGTVAWSKTYAAAGADPARIAADINANLPRLPSPKAPAAHAETP
jgi:hypothetical protein